MNLERLRSTTLPSVLLATSLAVPAAITDGCADTRGEILEVDLNALGFSIDGSRPRSLLVSASFLGNDAQSSCDTSTAVFSFEDLEDMDASRYLFPDGCPTSRGGFVTEFGVGGSDIQGGIIEGAETDVEYWGDAVGRVEAEVHISTPFNATFSTGGYIGCDVLEDGGACTVTPDEASD